MLERLSGKRRMWEVEDKIASGELQRPADVISPVMQWAPLLGGPPGTRPDFYKVFPRNAVNVWENSGVCVCVWGSSGLQVDSRSTLYSVIRITWSWSSQRSYKLEHLSLKVGMCPTLVARWQFQWEFRLVGRVPLYADLTSAEKLWPLFPCLLLPFPSFWADSIYFPPWHVQPCGDTALDALLIRLSGERPFGWIYVPHFLCIINSVLWGKEQNVMARPPQRNVPISEEEFYCGGGQLTASHYTGHIFFFLYNCITANDKWRMFDSWLRCLTATVLARGPWQALDFCSKWVKHIRHYEGTEAWRTRAEMSDPGRLLGTQLAK